MKKVMALMVIFGLLSSGIAFASGGKNHGTKGKGTTSTGSGSKGTASQPRTGR